MEEQKKRDKAQLAELEKKLKCEQPGWESQLGVVSDYEFSTHLLSFLCRLIIRVREVKVCLIIRLGIAWFCCGASFSDDHFAFLLFAF